MFCNFFDIKKNRRFLILFICLFILNFNLTKSLKADSTNQAVYEVNIDPNLLASDNGSLNEKTAVIFLKKAYEQGILKKETPDFPNPQCMQVKELGIKGAQTLKLFAVQLSTICLQTNSSLRKDSNYSDYHTGFILKELVQGFDEANNVHKVKNSELKELAVEKEDHLPVLAFQHHNLSYQDFNKKVHVLSLLHAAKGEEIKNLHDQLAADHKNNKISSPQYTYKKDFLMNAFYSTGKSLGAMHYKYMEPAGDIFGLTHVHADLHMENIFFDGKKVTFIDNETFVISLEQKQSILVDITRFIGFTISNPNSRYFHSIDIPADVWREVAVEPFIKGYIAGYPADKKAEVTTKLKDMLLNISVGELHNLWRGGANAELWETAKEKYLKPTFSKIG